jgi:hypothetical protein
MEKFTILDDFPFWTTYLLAGLVAVGFLSALTLLIRSLRPAQRNVRATRDLARRRRQAWFFVTAGALALWFLGSSMYFRFHAVAVEPEQIELIFFWPRPPAIVAPGDLVEMKLVPAYRPCGHMEVTTTREHFLSVNFKNCKPAEELLNEVLLRTKRNS